MLIRIKQLLCVIIIVFLLSPALCFGEEDRLLLEAEVNHKPCILAFDTGSRAKLILFDTFAQKHHIAIKTEDSYSWSNVDITIGGKTWENRPTYILKAPVFSDIDGIMGWPALTDGIWSIDWSSNKLMRLKDLPQDIDTRQEFLILKDFSDLRIEAYPDSAYKISIDTGAGTGISLPTPLWHQWVSENPNLKFTLQTCYLPSNNQIVTTKVSYAHKTKIEGLDIEDTLVENNPFGSLSHIDDHTIVLGTGALKHFEIIISINTGKLYLKKRKIPESRPEYNRLGATFIPSSLEDVDLIGKVLADSPAFRAGLRNGDILLKVNGIDMTKWNQDPEIGKKAFWSAPAGTKYKLEIRRNNKILTIEVVLEDILIKP